MPVFNNYLFKNRNTPSLIPCIGEIYKAVKNGFIFKQSKNWFENKVYCFDINETNIKDFKALLNVFFEDKGIFDINYKNMKIADTLFFDFDFHFDFSFGNPPYIRTKNLEENYLKELRNKYKSCEKGNVDIYYAFIELMNDISDISSFIVPNSYIYNISARKLRETILENICSIIDFKNTLIFKNARTYTSIYKTNNLTKQGYICYKENLKDEALKTNKIKLNNNHWIFNEILINKEGTSIVDLYNCYGSIATLKDKAFIIEEPKEIMKNNRSYFIKKYNEKEYEIESDICKDFYKITKLKKQNKIIYPYVNNEIMDEDFLKSNYPSTYQYLEDIKSELNQRDKGKVDKYESWFAYGRKQGLTKKKETIFLFLPLMASKEYKCTKIIKEDVFLISSGFVLGFDREEEADKIKVILESGVFFEYLKLKGKPWAGKEPYYSFTKTHLRDFLI